MQYVLGWIRGLAAALLGGLPLAGHAQAAVWPQTVDEAVSDVLRQMPAAEQQRLRAMSEEDLILLHFQLGMGIRNQYGLRQGNGALLASACGDRACHPDEASMRILEAVWRRLQNPPPAAQQRP